MDRHVVGILTIAGNKLELCSSNGGLEVFRKKKKLQKRPHVLTATQVIRK
jgi:hypothetical protein